MKLTIKPLCDEAVAPKYGSAGAGCFDLVAVSVTQDGNTTVCSTGLAFEIPPGWLMLIFSRSGHGFNHGIRLSNCVGVIDSDYRGEVLVKLHQDTFSPHFFVPGDSVAQAMLIPVPKIEFETAETLSETERGANGFGSTDKKA